MTNRLNQSKESSIRKQPKASRTEIQEKMEAFSKRKERQTIVERKLRKTR